jgi:hypothetical protein
MIIEQTEFEKHVSAFVKNRGANHRYASYDYCYNHFHPTNRIIIKNDIEKSCLSLGFYLASWGMFRGSSFLLRKSVKHFEPLIEYISELDSEVWEIDAHNLNDKHEQLIEVYKKICELFIPDKCAHLTLATKIMLGVFGSVPAYDRFFIDTFKEIFQDECGFTRFSKKSLLCINKFYLENKEPIEALTKNIATLSFNGRGGGYNYTRSKVIDMYGFTKGLNS